MYLNYDKKYPLHVVAAFPVPIEWAYRRDSKGFLRPVDSGKFAQRSQDLEKAYYETGPFSLFHISHILSNTPATDENFISILVPIERAVDIDDVESLHVAETLYLGNCVRNRPEFIKKIFGKKT